MIERRSVLFGMLAGASFVTRYLHPASMTCVDLSERAVRYCQQRHVVAGLKFMQGDAQNLPFGDDSFDRVVANFALLHLADPERACAEACRVLKAGGKFGFTTWAKASERVCGSRRAR